MKKQDYNLVRSGLSNYIGSLINSSNLTGKSKKHDVVAILMEEAISIAKDEDNDSVDLYILKPMIKGNLNIFKARKYNLEKQLDQFSPLVKDQAQEQIKEYDSMIKLLSRFIDNVNHL